MSGILWQEMLGQGMVRTRSEATQLVRQGAVRCSHPYWPEFRADCDNLELPGKFVVKVGAHMFRLVSRRDREGWDQLRGRIEIPVTGEETPDGGIHIKLSELTDDSLWPTAG